MIAKFGTCKQCGKALKGLEVIYWPRLRQAYCLECGEEDYLQAKSACYEEDYGMPLAY